MSSDVSILEELRSCFRALLDSYYDWFLTYRNQERVLGAIHNDVRLKEEIIQFCKKVRTFQKTDFEHPGFYNLEQYKLINEYYELSDHIFGSVQKCSNTKTTIEV